MLSNNVFESIFKKQFISVLLQIIWYNNVFIQQLNVD